MASGDRRREWHIRDRLRKAETEPLPANAAEPWAFRALIHREIKGTTAGYGLDQWRWELHQRPRRLISLRMISRMIAPIVALMMAVMMPEPR